MYIEKFVTQASSLLVKNNQLSRSGAVLYSGAHTFTKGDIYILGLNPGGTGGQSIAENLEKLPGKSHNSYLDEPWGNRDDSAAGQAPLQLRIKAIAGVIGYDLRDICASNLIFMQSKDANGVEYPNDANICWSIHEIILDVVKPRLIIAFGNSSRSPYRYLLHKFNKDGHEDILESGHGSWKCRGFEALIDGRRVYVAGFPHLSRYSPFDRDQNVREHLVSWLKGNL